MRELVGELVADIPSLVGELTTEGIISGELVADIPTLEGELISDVPVLEGELVADIPSMECELVAVTESLALASDLILTTVTEDNLPVYDGTYEITPLAETEQFLETSGKKMVDDVVILSIPYAETSNSAGGMTVTIG